MPDPTPPLSSERVEAIRRALLDLYPAWPTLALRVDAVARCALTAAGIDALEAECDAQREVISRITDEATDLIGERDAAVESEGRLRAALTEAVDLLTIMWANVQDHDCDDCRDDYQSVQNRLTGLARAALAEGEGTAR